MLILAASSRTLDANGKPGLPRCEQLATCRPRMQAGLALLAKTQSQAALVELDAAYQASRDPALLASIGQAQQQLGLFEQAIDNYQLYLKEVPTDAHERQHVLQALTGALLAAPPPPESELPASSIEPTKAEVSKGALPVEHGPFQGPAKVLPAQQVGGFALLGIGAAALIPSIMFAGLDGKPAGMGCPYGQSASTPCRYATQTLFSVGFTLSGSAMLVGASLLLLPRIGYARREEARKTCVAHR